MSQVTNLKKKKMTPCIMRGRIQEIERQLGTMNESANRIEKSVKRIETAVIGDEDAGIEGLAHRVLRHGKSIDGHTRLLWIGSGVIIFIAGIWEIFKEFHK
jgi:hypothetical protein